MMGLVGVAVGMALGLLFNCHAGPGRPGLHASSPRMTDYMALISGRVYPTLGLDKLLQRTSDRADHRRPGVSLSGPRSGAARTRRSPALRVRSAL